MKLENQVVCRELSEKIEKLGVKQESLFYWINYYGGSNKPLWEVVWYERNRSGLSAYTASELGEMLPNYVSISLCGGGRNSERVDYLVCENQNLRESWLAHTKREIDWVSFRDRTLANAMAKMLIWLIENDKLEVK